MSDRSTGRLLQITHRTGYRYGSPVEASFNEVRMTPLDGDGQVLIAHELHVEPSAEIRSYTDYWGALVESFDVRVAHRVLEVTSVSTVETSGSRMVPAGATWADVRAGSVQDRWCEFLGTTDYVDDARSDSQRVEVVRLMLAADSPRQATDIALRSVRDRMAYTPGATHVSTTAREAWISGHGVCQDFTHVMLSLLRAAGLPARYVSGYLHDDDGEVGRPVHGESHAWVEVWDGGWRAVDPTNERPVGPAHVVVIRGRDYADVPPLKGIYAGGRSEALGVDVEITRLAG